MMSFGALKYFESVIEKLKNIIVLYQPRDLHLCNGLQNIPHVFNTRVM